MVFISDKRAALERMNERVKTGCCDACDKRLCAVNRRWSRINAGSDYVAYTCYGCKCIFDYAKDYNINIIEEENETENKTKKKDVDVVEEEAVARRILRLLLPLRRRRRRHKSYFRKPLSFNSCMKDSDTERLTDSG